MPVLARARAPRRWVLAGLLATSGCVLIGYEPLSGQSSPDAGLGLPNGGRGDAGQPHEELDGSTPPDATFPGRGDASQALGDGSLDADGPGGDPDGGIDLSPGAPFDAAVVDVCPVGQDCAPSCSKGPCLLDCTEAETCQPDCAAKSRCEVECLGTNNCDLRCGEGAHCGLDCAPSADERTNNCRARCEPGARCGVHCRDVNNCEVRCEEKSQCAIDCTGANNCDAVECESGAKCLLYCPGGDCLFKSCTGGARSCPDGTLACGVNCPSEEDFTWEDFPNNWGSPP